MKPLLNRMRTAWRELSESMTWLVEKLAGVDVRAGEAIIIWACLGNGVQILSEDDGHSLSPFLFSSLQYLLFNPRHWAMALIVVGLMQVAAFVPALFGDRFRLGRAWVKLIAGGMLLAVSGAVFTSDHSPIVAWRYVLPCAANFTFSYILWLRHDVKAEYQRLLAQSAGEKRGSDSRPDSRGSDSPLPVREAERVMLDVPERGNTRA